MHKRLPIAEPKEDILKDYPDWYLKQCIEQGYEAMKAQQGESGEVVFKRLREKLAKKFINSQE